MITFTRVGEIIDVEDDEDEMEYEEDQISEITSPSSTEVASFHTLSETSSMVEDGADDIISIGDSSSGISR